MEQKKLLEAVTAALEQYRSTLPPGNYLFAPELLRGKVTGKIIEDRSDVPGNCPTGPQVTFGFFPLGFVPRSLQGAPPSWISGYPFLSGLEKLSEAPEVFLELLKKHVEAQLEPARKPQPEPVGDWHIALEEAS